MSNLLDVPIHRLLDDLSSKVANKLAIHDEQPEQPRSTSAGLWTETYRPKRYTDLLGDDRVHREVMLWVKEWDYCVFGKKKGKKRARDDDNPDEYRRPRERLMLISGPAGLGKTTLAHVVAKQAGYDVLEINASDARTASVVDELIRPALESGSKINSKRPTLIVVDEIDGATGSGENSNGFISRLIQLTHDKPKKRAKKGEAQGNRPLLRPIICICNELYANSLSKLRPHARIIRFNRPNDFRLVNRLRDICEIEGLKAESRALTTLVGLTQGDLRGCLNTLELIRKNDTEVTENAVRKAAGMKLGDVSQATVLNDLFSPMSRKRVKDLGVGEEEEARYVGRLSRNIEACGAMDKVAIGCFEHYVTLRKHDANFSRYLKANEWLSTYDLLSGEMRSEREYTILQYLPYMVVPFYPLFQERGAQKVERPKADWENYTQTQINEEVYNSLADCLRTASTRHGGAYRHLVSKGILQLEFAPMINRIISPPLRPVNQQVIKPDERAVLSRLVDIMATLQLRFVQEKSEEGQLMYRLEPPIDTFVTYDAKRASDIAVSRYAVRHLVASEIDARLIHHQVEAVEKTKSSASNLFTRKYLLTGRSASAVIKRPRREEVIEEKAAIDFFGRPIVVKTTPKIGPKSVSRKGLEKKPGVSYRFNEGNSAAVRKPVKVNTFL
ncbi:P-loop containing nucleoside triphosphate hydrolase protein [Cytidiella melzeri]|nr:P-loop containing nucleoside triphosphate hydrolase protein [Cytidiella melzeri]